MEVTAGVFGPIRPESTGPKQSRPVQSRSRKIGDWSEPGPKISRTGLDWTWMDPVRTGPLLDWWNHCLLLRTFGRELPDIGSYQEVHHRLIALLHGEQLRDLHVSASARSPSRCFPHLFPECFLLVSPPAAVAEEMLPCLGYRPTSAACV